MDLSAVTSMCQWVKRLCSPNIVVDQSTSLLEPHTKRYKINSSLPRYKRALLPRSTTAALINREGGRKTSEPTIILTMRAFLSWEVPSVTSTAHISEKFNLRRHALIMLLHSRNRLGTRSQMKGRSNIVTVLKKRIRML
jgi:hypothetical protein